MPKRVASPIESKSTRGPRSWATGSRRVIWRPASTGSAARQSVMLTLVGSLAICDAAGDRHECRSLFGNSNAGAKPVFQVQLVDTQSVRAYCYRHGFVASGVHIYDS